MPVKKDIWVFIIAIILLIPTIFFPASSDLSVFMLGGKIIANGGELYKDFFDLKAPLTYYFFALLNLITNDNIILTRIIDFLLTLTFLISVNFILKEFKFTRSIRHIYIVIFSMSYVSLNYSNTLQCETITYLPMIWYFYFVAKPSKYSTLIKGLLLGIIISFKYTLGIVFVAEFFMIDEFYKSKSKFIISKSLEILIALCLLLITFLPTILQGNIVYFENVVNYLNKYKNFPPLNLGFFKSFIKELGNILGDLYSIIFTSSAVVGLIYISKQKSDFRQRLLNLVLVIFLLLLLSFIIERKPTLYQFSRVYPFLVLLTSIGIYHFYKVVSNKNKYILTFVLIFILFLSPLPRIINLIRLPINYFTQKENYLNFFSHEGGTGNFKSLLNLKNYTDNHSRKFIFINTGSHQFLRMTNSYYKYPQSAFYLADYENKNIQQNFTRDLIKTDYFILQNDDNHYVSFFNYKSSLENFNRIKEFKSLLNERFELDTIIDGRYYIYKNDKLINEN